MVSVESAQQLLLLHLNTFGAFNSFSTLNRSGGEMDLRKIQLYLRIMLGSSSKIKIMAR